MRDIASQLCSFQPHVEDRDIWPMQTHEIDCFCNVGCHAANFMALIQQCCLQKVGKHYVIIDNQDFHRSPFELMRFCANGT